MNSLKNALRKEFKILRREVKDRTEKEKRIFSLFVSSELFSGADNIFLYASSDCEVSTELIAEFCEASGIRTAYPYCVDKNGIMEFYFSDRNSLKIGMFGIAEPDIEKCEKGFFTENSLCIVPGIAFGKNGERLGYGKGYYDRFLENFSGTVIALSFEESLSDKIPMEKHDKKTDYLITDKKIYKIL